MNTEPRQLRPIDNALADFLARQCPSASLPARQIAALVSYQLATGHLGMPLTDNQTFLKKEARALLPGDSAQTFIEALDSTLDPSKNPLLSCDGTTPLVRDDNHIYLHRYWQLQKNIAQQFSERLRHDYYHTLALTPSQIATELKKLFTPENCDNNEPGWQQVACVLAPQRGIGVVTGGPGTGKTYTVVRLLALQQLLQLAANKPLLGIKVAAPTGKAADRLGQSIRGELSKLDALPQPLLDSLPQKATTLHRLLGTQRHSRHFRHHSTNPLQADLVVVDEASMLDIDMMHALLDALPTYCRLVLVGDKDQLASVEPGAVMQDICHRADVRPYSESTTSFLNELGFSTSNEATQGQASALHDQTVSLRKSRRAEGAGWILKLANHINGASPQNQAANSALALIDELPDTQLARIPWTFQPDNLSHQHDTWIKQQLFDGDTGIKRLLASMEATRPAKTDSSDTLDKWADQLLQQLNQQQLLTPMRRGTVGIDTLNQAIRQVVIRLSGMTVKGDFFAGEPLLVTRNLYDLGVMNGDMGLVLDVPGKGLRVAFYNGTRDDGNPHIRWLLPEQLDGQCQGGYAITVHQSQGSGYANTLLILPDQPGAVLTKELLYTAVTRSSKRFVLIESANKSAVFTQAANTRTERHSALFFKLHTTK